MGRFPLLCSVARSMALERTRPIHTRCFPMYIYKYHCISSCLMGTPGAEIVRTWVFCHNFYLHFYVIVADQENYTGHQVSRSGCIQQSQNRINKGPPSQCYFLGGCNCKTGSGSGSSSRSRRSSSSSSSRSSSTRICVDLYFFGESVL